VTVVFTDVTCEGMRNYMWASSKQEEDCMESPTCRRESFERFSERVGVSQVDLDHDYLYVVTEAGLSVTGQVIHVLEASNHTWSLVRGAGRGESLSTVAVSGQPQLSKATHFADQLDKLRKKLSEPPSALFEELRHRHLVNQTFPRFQVGVIGLGGVGKSTMLLWLSYYAVVASTSRALFGVDRTSGKSFTRKLTECGMGKMYQDAPFAVFDTMGLDREMMTNMINHDLVWLVDGHVRTTCEMKWLGRVGRSWDCGCYQPWNEPPEQLRALHELLFVTRFFLTDSEDFSLIKHFIQDLRSMLHEKQRELVIEVTHLEGCDKTLTAEACRRKYDRLLGICLGNVIVLSATHRVPPSVCNEGMALPRQKYC